MCLLELLSLSSRFASTLVFAAVVASQIDPVPAGRALNLNGRGSL